jgi:hypothetical protein
VPRPSPIHLAAVAAALLLVPSLRAQALRQRDALSGLHEIRVAVAVNSDARRAGVDSARVATSVEYELRRAGLRVAGDEAPPGEGTGYASAAVDCVEAATATRSVGFACYVAFSLDQFARLQGATAYAPQVRARTWSDGSLLLGAGPDIDARVHGELRTMLERLGNALLAASGR